MRQWLQRYLGIDSVERRIDELNEQQQTLAASVRLSILNTKVTNLAVARMIAALDPMYHKDELSPARKAQSDRIGQEILNRLWAEQKARQHSLGGSDEEAPPSDS